MVVLVNRQIFGGGAYSTTHSRILKMVGHGERKMTEVQVAQPKGKIRLPNGLIRNCAPEPYMPKKLTDLLHPSGNSVCYQLQIATLMGYDPIYLMGFTLKKGTPYFFGRDHPVYAGRVGGFYDEEVPMAFLRWYQKNFPNRARLLPGWDGPIYSALPMEDFHGTLTPPRA